MAGGTRWPRGGALITALLCLAQVTTVACGDEETPPAGADAANADSEQGDASIAEVSGADVSQPGDCGADSGADSGADTAICAIDGDCSGKVDLAGLACGAARCVAGACVKGAAPDGKPCDDGDACTAWDVCKAGASGGSTRLSTK